MEGQETPSTLLLDAPVIRHYVPSKPLSDYIALFWYWNHKPEAVKEQILPGGTVEFVIRLKKNHNAVFRAKNTQKAESFSGSVITGPHSEFFVLDKSEQDELLGVHFKPGGAAPFFGVPVDKFLNDHVSLEDVWGSDAETLRSELLESKSIDDKFRILEKHLLQKSVRHMQRHPAVGYALKELSAARSLSDIASDVNLSGKRLTQLFSREIGVTPKLFTRLQRFQEVLKTLATRSTINLANVALACGYYDQAHFNHDFIEFSGMNPTAYMQKKIAHLGHVPL